MLARVTGFRTEEGDPSMDRVFVDIFPTHPGWFVKDCVIMQSTGLLQDGLWREVYGGDIVGVSYAIDEDPSDEPTRVEAVGVIEWNDEGGFWDLRGADGPMNLPIFDVLFQNHGSVRILGNRFENQELLPVAA